MSVASDLAKTIINAAEGNKVKSAFDGQVTVSYDVNYDTNTFNATIVLPVDGTSWNNTTSKLETNIADSLEAITTP